MSQFRVIEGGFDKRPESDPRAIQFLREALAHAEAGGICCALVVMVTADGMVIDGWSTAEKMRPYTMIGALESIKRDYMDMNIEHRRDR